MVIGTKGTRPFPTQRHQTSRCSSEMCSKLLAAVGLLRPLQRLPHALSITFGIGAFLRLPLTTPIRLMISPPYSQDPMPQPPEATSQASPVHRSAGWWDCPRRRSPDSQPSRWTSRPVPTSGCGPRLMLVSSSVLLLHGRLLKAMSGYSGGILHVTHGKARVRPMYRSLPPAWSGCPRGKQ